MRSFVLVFLLVSATLTASGQDFHIEPAPLTYLVAATGVSTQTTPASPFRDISSFAAEPSGIGSVQHQQYKVPTIPGERRIKVGKTLTAIGATMIIAGILVYDNRQPESYSNGYYTTTTTDDPNVVGGQMLVGIGSGLLVPGVLVWIHGASIYRRNIDKEAQGLYIPAGKLGIGYRF